jgi:hypothetical protein
MWISDKPLVRWVSAVSTSNQCIKAEENMNELSSKKEELERQKEFNPRFL